MAQLSFPLQLSFPRLHCNRILLKVAMYGDAQSDRSTFQIIAVTVAVIAAAAIIVAAAITVTAAAAAITAADINHIGDNIIPFVTLDRILGTSGIHIILNNTHHIILRNIHNIILRNIHNIILRNIHNIIHSNIRKNRRGYRWQDIAVVGIAN